METIFKDIRYGLRGLLKRKAFAAIAVLTLSLGIGANTAIFTLVNAVMLKSLPVDKPEELVLFSDTTGEGTSLEDTPRSGQWQRFSYASYEYFRDHNQSFQDIAALRRMFATFEGGELRAHLDEYSEVNIEFHQAIIRMSGNSVLISLAENLFTHMRMIRRKTIVEKDRADRSIRDHMNIIEALEARDTARAEELVRNHALGLAEHVAKYADYLD